MGWARVVPSSRLLFLIILTTVVTVAVCVTSCVILWLAPQVPYSVHYNGGRYVHYPALVLAATALVSALSLFPGAFGLSRDSKAALILYCVMLVTVTAGEVIGSATVFSFAYIGKLESAIGSGIRHDLELFDNNTDSSISYRINSLQSHHHCCGVESYIDWNDTKWKKEEAGEYQLAPESCCKAKSSSGPNCSSSASMIYHTGCVGVLLGRTKIAVDSSLGGSVTRMAQQQQQYSYGYGYGYAPGAVGYGVQMPSYGTTGTPARPPAQQTYQAQAYTPQKSSTTPVQQQPAVNQAQGSYYSGQNAGATGTSVTSYTSPLSRPPVTMATSTEANNSRLDSSKRRHSKPASRPTTNNTPRLLLLPLLLRPHPLPRPPSSHQGVGYGSSPIVAALPSVAYPTTYSTPYYSPAATANRYGISTGVNTTTQPGVKSVYSTPPYTPSSASYPSTASYNATQEKVIAHYIAQKTAVGSGAGKFQNKRPYNPNNQAVYFCEVCKISCASSMTYKTHLEGKAHKKNLSKQQASGANGAGGEGGGGEKTDYTSRPHYCPLCEIQCTSSDSYEAHIRGSRHTKVLNLFRKLGKTIPNIKLPEGTEITNTVGGKKVAVSAPRINFVGGQQLTSTGAAGKSSGPPSLYPPCPGGPTAVVGPTALVGGQVKTEGGEGEIGAGEEAVDVEPVGEQFVVPVTNDPKFPHAMYKCTMCDCYFNDDWAKKAHAKGRRHPPQLQETLPA
ncbi:Zinc finger RNA-binding protein [Geodia barretti]|uniref:Zinc finger RNA-binding protein n=1 Tax=Geodia barretti TaxID=519541 RepID=A0AA35U250_GEOBA|nr:Zinc finger RNA-binding protein [Geodia barretti]